MARQQPYTFYTSWGDADNYLTGSGSVDISFAFPPDSCVATQKVITSTTGYATLKTATVASLFPNSVAKPVRLTASTSVRSSSGTHHIYMQVDGTEIASTSVTTSKKGWEITSESDAVKAATRNSTIRFYFVKSSTLPSNNMLDSLQIDLYFTQYDFAAVAGEGIAYTFADAHGFDGDTIYFDAETEPGYVFAGWYDGDTLVSSRPDFFHTVNGADLTLTARAEVLQTREVNVSYGGAVISTAQEVPPVAVGYGRRAIATVGAGETRTLVCDGKLMRGDVTVGSRTLKCAGRVMDGDVTVAVV